MSRTLLAVALLLSQAGLLAADQKGQAEQDVQQAQDLAAARQQFDWSEWKAFPVLHDGRIKPLDTLADETVTLVTARSGWTDPVTGVKYSAPELLYAWMTALDEWAHKPVIRCEYQPLRRILDVEFIREEHTDTVSGDGVETVFRPVARLSEQTPLVPGSLSGTVLLNDEPAAEFDVSESGEFQWRPVDGGTVPAAGTFDAETGVLALTWNEPPGGKVECLLDYKYHRNEIPEKGTYVSTADVIDWDAWTQRGRFEYRSKDLEERFRAIRMAQMQTENRSTPVGDTREERAINDKVRELILHVEAFIFAGEAQNTLIVPNLDPRVLKKQTNPDAALRPWVSLGSLLRIDRWRDEIRPDPTVAAVMAEDPLELLDELVLHGLDKLSRRVGAERDWNELKQLHERFQSEGALPASAYPEEHIPQLARVQEFKGELRVRMQEIKPALDATREAYDRGDAAGFTSAMQTFVRQVRRLADVMENSRPRMTPPEPRSISFGRFDDAIWQQYKPLELDERQMSFSAYPEPGSTRVELVYNKYQPFRSAWIFFLAALVVVVLSTMVKVQRSMYVAGMAITAGAILYSSWGFLLRIIIAERAPVTNMYETVVWVAYVVAILGLWFCLLPLTWPGLSWAWRLTGLPLRTRRDEQGRFRGVEPDSVLPEERDNFLASLKLPIQTVMSVPRLAAFGGLMWFLSQSNTTFNILELNPWKYTGSTGVWVVAMMTVLLTAFYTPRVALTLLLSPLFVATEVRRSSEDLWEQTFARRYFLFGALPVACFGMMLAHFVGVRSPDILDPRVGSIAAVLRNNYWLTIHVLTIVSSYGAGALAWGLGNLAMLYYLFGKYRTEGGTNGTAGTPGSPGEAGKGGEQAASDPIFDLDAAYGNPDSFVARMKKAGGALKPGNIGGTLKAGFRDFGSGDEHLEGAQVRPPREVSTLASFSYKSMQVAILLLAAGTILGGLWADVSWGRFWDWDPKEVWALISLLVYLAVLHGRFAGWVGTFGTNVGAVACFSAILMSWYGVNFVLPMIHGWLQGTGEPTEVGLHSYATGDGGLEYVIAAVALNALLVVAALGRYVVETTPRREA